MREIIYHSHIRPNIWLGAGQQRYGGLVLRGKRFFPFPNIEVGCGVHPSSCLLGSLGSLASSNSLSNSNTINNFMVYPQNIRGLLNKTEELISFLSPDFPQLLCLAEYHLKHSN